MFQFPAFASYTLFYSGEDTLLTIPRNLCSWRALPALIRTFVLTLSWLAPLRSGQGGASAPTAIRPCEAQTRFEPSSLEPVGEKGPRSQLNRFSRHLRWVAPFGDPWIKAYSQLPTAFRSVSRPSSPVHA